MITSIKRLSTAENDAQNLSSVTVQAGFAKKIYENLVLNTTGILKQLTLCNTSDKPSRTTVAIKTDAETLSLANALFYKAYIPAGQTVVIDLSSVVESTKGLYVAVDVNGGDLNVSAQGVELLNAVAKQLVSAMVSDSYTFNYETPANKETIIYQILAVNGSTLATSITVQAIPPAGQLDVKNAILYNVVVQPNETLMFETKTPLPAGYKLAVKASHANNIHVIVDGTEK